MKVIRLNKNHFNECIKIAICKSKVSGTTPSNINEFAKKIEKYFSENDMYFAFGVIDDSETLQSWMSIFFTENVTRGKYWAITSFYSKNSRTLFSFKNPEYGALLRYCVDLAEGLDYNQFYYSVSKKISRAFSKKWLESELSSGTYELIDKDIIPANTRPQSNLYWGLMGEELKPHDIIIKHRIKKNK